MRAALALILFAALVVAPASAAQDKPSARDSLRLDPVVAELAESLQPLGLARAKCEEVPRFASAMCADGYLVYSEWYPTCHYLGISCGPYPSFVRHWPDGEIYICTGTANLGYCRQSTGISPFTPKAERLALSASAVGYPEPEPATE